MNMEETEQKYFNKAVTLPDCSYGYENPFSLWVQGECEHKHVDFLSQILLVDARRALLNKEEIWQRPVFGSVRSLGRAPDSLTEWLGGATTPETRDPVSFTAGGVAHREVIIPP